MEEKDFVLKNIEDLSAEQLADAINKGTVTLEELKATNNLDNTKRKAILGIEAEKKKMVTALQVQKDNEDDAAWESAKYGNENSLRDYITNLPNGKYVREAKDRIDNLESERRKQRAQQQNILDKIKQNPNSYTANDILNYLGNGTITKEELINNCDIPPSAINSLDNIKAPFLQIGETPSSIPDGYTEVYFWGGTGSGKTCALGAVLQMADKDGYLNIATGPGYNYSNQLKNIFSHNGEADDFLPAPSPLEVTQYLPFSLKNINEKAERSVSLIELSGEIFKCFFNKNAGLQFPTQSHEDTFNSLNRFLKSNNRKIHFFFIDYNKENRPDGNGVTQSDYLAAAATYFENNNVFNKSTDAIYIVLTKSDLMLDQDGNAIDDYNQRVNFAKTYLQENYKSFINTIKNSCKKYSINGGKLEVEPFSLGKVYFKEICDFDGTSAKKIVKILLERIAGSKKSILDIFNK
ncbi:MAG: hypothetical protein K2Q03_04105 [Sphingobacteriaceae bacterium]|nr:hypothetical protein [Sphingobacteriaceae bacterium]